MESQQGPLTNVLPGVEKISEDIARKQKEKQIQRARDEFEQRINKIADQILDLRSQNAEGYLIEMLTTFLDVALEMQSITNTLQATTEALACITSAVSFVDQMLDFNMDMFNESLVHRYTPFQRWKQRRKMKKAIRNNVGRMQMLVDSISSQLKFATKLVDEMRGATVRIKKMNMKRLKKTGGEVVTTDKTASYLEKRSRERGGGPSNPAAGSFGAAPSSSWSSGAASPTTTDNIDDITGGI